MNKITIDSLLRIKSNEYSERPFLFVQESGEEYSYQEFDRLTENTARFFVEEGIAKGDKVGILLSNTVEFLLAYLGAIRAGAIAIPMNPTLKEVEIHNLLRHSNAKAFVSESGILNSIRQFNSSIPKTNRLIQSSLLRTARVKSVNLHLPEITPDDPAIILYTSGTTGEPKGVVLSHWNLVINAMDIANALEFHDERMMCILPLHHTNGQVINFLTPLSSGGSVLLSPAYNVLGLSGFWQNVINYKVNVIDMVPTVLTILNSLKTREKPDLASLKYVICGAAPLTIELQEQFEARYQCPVVQEYGLTEATCVSSINSLKHRKLGSIGLSLRSNKVKIVRNDGSESPQGEVGEIVINGENVMQGYYLRPDLTDEIIKDGWLYTGDMGEIDADGFIFIVGRKKEIIIKGGENIYPLDIENILYKHPAVSECTVVGIDDKIYGENIKAFIVLRDGYKTTTSETLLFCRQNLPNFWCPVKIEFVDHIPRTASGKVIKRTLVNKS